MFPPGAVLYPGMLLPLHIFEERGGVEVFVGNILQTVPYMLKHSDLFDELPESQHDSAFLDRLHHYIPGRVVDAIEARYSSNP